MTSADIELTIDHVRWHQATGLPMPYLCCHGLSSEAEALEEWRTYETKAA